MFQFCLYVITLFGLYVSRYLYLIVSQDSINCPLISFIKYHSLTHHFTAFLYNCYLYNNFYQTRRNRLPTNHPLSSSSLQVDKKTFAKFRFFQPRPTRPYGYIPGIHMMSTNLSYLYTQRLSMPLRHFPPFVPSRNNSYKATVFGISSNSNNCPNILILLYDLLALSHILEEHIVSSVQQYQSSDSYNTHQNTAIQRLVQFYSQPELTVNQVAYSSLSFTQQLFETKGFSSHQLKPTNYFYPLICDFDDEMPQMDIDETPLATNDASHNATLSWMTDAGISALSENLFSRMQDRKKLHEDSGKVENNSLHYQKPIPIVEDTSKCNQRIHFNLIRHRGTVSDIPILKLFKSFTSTLKKVDPSIIILPFSASKQHYSSLSTLKQIQTIDDNKLHQFFKTYHQKQLYSLSGYFHISLQISFEELCQTTQVSKWLDSYCYFMRLCPSQTKEMVQIGALCYSSLFMFCEDLKQAIISHPQWTPSDKSSSLIFDIYVGNFNTSGNRTKMLFVSAEKSKQEEVSSLFKTIYDGTKKSYPNGSMMLFLSFKDMNTSSPDIRKKILYNHEKFIGNKTLTCIGGLQNLNSTILLKNGHSVTLCTLLKSFPASVGMARPQLFQQAEPNHGGMVTIVTFQEQDRPLVVARQETLEDEICHVIADGKSEKVFLNDIEGLWFGGVNRNKSGHTCLGVVSMWQNAISTHSTQNSISNEIQLPILTYLCRTFGFMTMCLHHTKSYKRYLQHVHDKLWVLF